MKNQLRRLSVLNGMFKDHPPKYYSMSPYNILFFYDYSQEMARFLSEHKFNVSVDDEGRLDFRRPNVLITLTDK